MKVVTEILSDRGNWIPHPSKYLPDTSAEALVLSGKNFFPARTVTVEYEDGTSMRYTKV